MLPDRSKYVNMQKHFLKSYMDLLVHTCHQRGAPATGGMVPVLMPPRDHTHEYKTLMDNVSRLA